MKKYSIALLALLFTMINLGSAQDPVVINFVGGETSGSTFTVDVTTDNFVDITGMQFYIAWDNTVLTYNSITNINSELDGFNASSFATPPSIPGGHVNVSWFTTNTLGLSETLPDGTRLFSIVLNVIGQPCDETSFDLVDFNGQPNEAYDGNFNELVLTYNPGVVLIPGTDCGSGGEDCYGIQLNVEKLIGQNGTNVCVGIAVDSFVNISSVQFGVQYDPAVLEYTGYMDGPLTDELVNPWGGSYIRFVWVVPSDEEPNTLPDGTTLIEFCFNVIGNEGDISPVDVISITLNPTLEIEFIGENGTVDYCVNPGSITVGDPGINPVTFIASDETGDAGETICVDITTENFEDVGGFQWAFGWDNTVMTYTGLGTINNINIKPTDINQVANNLLRISWFPTTGLTKPDGTILFQLCYELTGDCGDQTNASFLNDGNDFQIEVGDADGNPLPFALDNGSASIECACSLSYTSNNVSCNGEKDGNIYITLMGCTGQSFLWNTGQTTQNLQGIGAGSYVVTVTDTDGGQTVSPVISITEPSPFIVTGSLTHVSCQAKGSIQLNVTGGTPGYNFFWNPSISTGPTASNLDAGQYSVTVTDNNNCEEVKNFTITSGITALEVDGTMVDMTCKDANDGMVNVTATGGCFPYTIVWSDGQAAGLFTRSGLPAGTYTATVTDNAGQILNKSFTITSPAFALTINGTVTDAVMGGNGTINITPMGGQAPYTFAWDTGATTEDITAPAGEYTVYVTDARNCSTEATFTILEFLDEVTVDAAQASTLYNGYGVSCYGECDGKINLSVVANEPWTLFVDGVETDMADFPQMSFCAGNHTIKVVDAIDLETTVTVTVDEPEALEVVLDEIICSSGDDGSIAVTVSGGVEDYQYNWGITGENGPVVEYLEAGIYGLVVTDANKCQALLSNLEVDICPTGDCFVASPVVTPNNDGINDYFAINCLKQYAANKLDVYDRWGRKVYDEENYGGTWQGTGVDGELDEGSYMWVLTVFLANDDQRIYKGTVTILR